MIVPSPPRLLDKGAYWTKGGGGCTHDQNPPLGYLWSHSGPRQQVAGARALDLKLGRFPVTPGFSLCQAFADSAPFDQWLIC